MLDVEVSTYQLAGRDLQLGDTLALKFPIMPNTSGIKVDVGVNADTGWAQTQLQGRLGGRMLGFTFEGSRWINSEIDRTGSTRLTRSEIDNLAERRCSLRTQTEVRLLTTMVVDNKA